MDLMTDGADIGTMLTGVSAVTAAATWTAGRVRGWRERRLARSRRTWHGYIAAEGIDTWYVRLAEDPDAPSGRVVLEVLNRDGGEPDDMLAHGMRQIILQDGMLSRSPTPGEYEFLKDQRKERGYGNGFPVR